MGDHILPSESFEMQERRVDPLPAVPNPEENNRRSGSARRVRFVIPPDEFFDDDFPPEVVVTQEERELEKHCHDVKRKKIVDYKCPRKKTMNAIGICGVFIVGEALGGYLAGSLAVAADACRMFGDFAGLMATLVTLYMVNDSSTKSRNFGYGRVVFCPTGVAFLHSLNDFNVDFFETYALINDPRITSVQSPSLYDKSSLRKSHSKFGPTGVAFLHSLNDFIVDFFETYALINDPRNTAVQSPSL
ncbi:unnamed protein product [Orchesella dallaii]|uniref:Cation efflux protein transmembrane domain-containing protein n=1 Tax=Orchesella dallaii TaxID=48710 RepID=A0ABP1PTS3_9HEXA